MNKEVLEALKDGERDQEVRCVMITGAGRAFCAGQDLKGRTPEQKGSLGASLREKYNPMIRQLRQMETIVIAAVNGVAAGAGCNFALACDLRVASEEAKFIQSFVRVGLAPDSGGSFILTAAGRPEQGDGAFAPRRSGGRQRSAAHRSGRAGFSRR